MKTCECGCQGQCQCHLFHKETINQVKETFYTEDEFLQLAEMFKLFNDPSRLKILEATKDHELCVCDLASLLGVSKSAVSHQMKLLKQYQLVSSQKVGKMVYYKACNHHARQMIDHAYTQMKGIKQHAKND